MFESTKRAKANKGPAVLIDKKAIEEFIAKHKDYKGDDLRIKAILLMYNEIKTGDYKEGIKYDIMALINHLINVTTENFIKEFEIKSEKDISKLTN